MDDLKIAADKFEILDHTPIGQFVLRKDFIVIFWNKCLEDWSGISRDKIVGTNLMTHFPHLEDIKYIDRINSVFNASSSTVFSGGKTG